MKMKVIGLALSSILTIQAMADQNHVEEAQNCSAQFFVMTALERVEPNLGQMYTKQGQFASHMASIYYEEANNSRASNGKMTSIKQKYLDKIKSSVGTSMTLESMTNCAGWIVSVGKQLQQKRPKSQEDFKRLVLASARPSENFPFPYENKSQFGGLIDLAKQLWFEAGAFTPDQLREALNNR